MNQPQIPSHILHNDDGSNDSLDVAPSGRPHFNYALGDGDAAVTPADSNRDYRRGIVRANDGSSCAHGAPAAPVAPVAPSSDVNANNIKIFEDDEEGNLNIPSVPNHGRVDETATTGTTATTDTAHNVHNVHTVHTAHTATTATTPAAIVSSTSLTTTNIKNLQGSDGSDRYNAADSVENALLLLQKCGKQETKKTNPTNSLSTMSSSMMNMKTIHEHDPQEHDEKMIMMGQAESLKKDKQQLEMSINKIELMNPQIPLVHSSSQKLVPQIGTIDKTSASPSNLNESYPPPNPHHAIMATNQYDPPPPPLDSARPQYDHSASSLTSTTTGPMQKLYQQQFVQQHHNIDYERGGGSSSAYRDLSIYPDPAPDNRRNRGGVTVPFPEKLHQMLEYVEKNGLTEIISFFPHGRAFAIHKPMLFVSDIMPKFFKQSRFTSFQRQVNLYGFRRLSQGPDSGGYYHELFLRGRPGLCINMKRTKVKGVIKTKTEPDSEPNFYNMPPIQKNSEATARMDRLLPAMTANPAFASVATNTTTTATTTTATTMPSRGMNVPPPHAPPFNSYGAPTRGGEMKTSKDDIMGMKKSYDPMMTQSRNSDPTALGGFTNPHINRTPHLTSLNMNKPTNDMMWSSKELQKDHQHPYFDLKNPNVQSQHKNLDGQMTTSAVYPQSSSLDLNFNYMNPTMGVNDYQSPHLPMSDINKQSSAHYDNIADMTMGNKLPSSYYNSGFSNQLMQMNQSINLAQSLKKTENVAAMSLLGSHDASYGLTSNTLGGLKGPLTAGQASGAPLGLHQSYFTPTSAISLQGMMSANPSMKGKDQSSVANFHQNFGTTPASFNQNISTTGNAFLGPQTTNFSSNVTSASGMQSSDLGMNSFVGGDMPTNYIGQQMMSQQHPPASNFITNKDYLHQNSPGQFSEMTINNSMMQNLASYGSNHMSNVGMINENFQNMQEIQHIKGSSISPMIQQSIHDTTFVKNDSINASNQSNEIQPFQNPFESDASGEANTKDIGKDHEEQITTSVGVTKV